MVATDPEDRERDQPEGAAVGGGLVVAGGEGTDLLAAVDRVLHPDAQAVGRAVERPRPVLAGPPGDGVADAAAAAEVTVLGAGVALVAGDPVGAQPGPAAPGAPDRAPVEQLGE